MVQVTVYTGAIMVLFLFVIMLLGAEATTDTSGVCVGWASWSTAVAILILLILGFPIASDMLNDDAVEQPDAKASLRIINAVSSGDGSESGVIEPGAGLFGFSHGSNLARRRCECKRRSRFARRFAVGYLL